ncbi:MAG: acyltransferase [Lachnospiraceae bacterium]|nr:acyltransferase [Lachnospiraceae bacterium]
MRREKLVYLDGIRGLGCAIVFLCHFVYAFYYGMYQYQEAACHLPGNFDIVIGKSPLNLFFNGNTAVRLFLVLSGYLLCRNYFLSSDKRALGKSTLRRYPRLMPPILVVNLFIFILMTLGLYQNGAAAALAGSEEWFAGFNSFSPSFPGMLWESLVGCFLFGSNDYLGVLWTMRALFLGAFLDYALAALVGGRRWRWTVYAVLAALLLRTDFLAIFLGYVLCDFVHTGGKLRDALCGNRALNWLFFAAGLYFMSYPSAGFGYERTIWGGLPFVFVNYYHVLGVLCFVFAAQNLEAVQRFFSLGPFRFLGRISYSLYLIHFPVIATFGTWFLLSFEARLGYNLASLLNLILVGLITVGLSELSARYIEPLGKKGEVLLGRIVGKKRA